MTNSLRRAGAATRLIIVGLLLVIPSMACDDVQACVKKWGEGRRIQVVLVNGGKLTGKVASLEADGFTLASDARGAGTRDLKYSELRSATTKMTTRKKWLIAGAVYGIVTVFFAVTIGK
jgi:hypothetical protein